MANTFALWVVSWYGRKNPGRELAPAPAPSQPHIAPLLLLCALSHPASFPLGYFSAAFGLKTFAHTVPSAQSTLPMHYC